jgi:iron(III) transport system permease protein
VLLIAFIVPVIQLLLWAWASLGDLDARYFGYTARSLGLSGMAASIAVLLALCLAYANRQAPHLIAVIGTRIATIGYALPGPVLAVGLFVPLAVASTLLQDIAEAWFGSDALAPLLHGGLAALLLAYVGRFLAVAHSPVASNMLRVSPNLDEAARGMGIGPTGLVARIHMPLLRGGLLTGAILVFVDVMKEMPITLMMRPFGWDTLAVRIFEMTAEGEWQRAALPAVTLLLAGLAPVILLSRQLERQRAKAIPDPLGRELDVAGA